MNKYTKAIDKIFEKYGKEEDQYILLGCCHDDYDLGELRYFGVDEILEKLEYFHDAEQPLVDPYPYEEGDDDKEAIALNDKFTDDLRKFLPKLWKAFPHFFKENYEGTNQYWYRCYFATRDHKLFQVLTSNWDPKDTEWEEVIELDNLSEANINDSADKEYVEKIEDHLDSIKALLRDIKSDKEREKILKKIEKVWKR